MVVEAAPAPVLSPPSTPAEQSGTPEEAWACSPLLGSLPVLDLPACPRALVVAPHPHDETLALGGTIAMLLGLGVPVTVVFATDGRPGRGRNGRDAESRSALAALGRGCSGSLRAVRLRVPDGSLPRSERNAAILVTGLLRPGDWCFSTWEKDGEPDHDAAGRIGREAARRARAWSLSYPVETWHRSTPQDPGCPWERACQVLLSAQAMLRKGLAMNCYDPPTAPAELAHFTRPYEVVFA